MIFARPSFGKVIRKKVLFMNTKENKNIWVEKVKNNLEMGGRSNNTIYNYQYAINRFLNSFDENIDIASFNESNIIDYVMKNFIQKKLSVNTYNLHICSIKLFYIVCFNKTFNDKLLPRSKTAKKLPKIISKDKFLEIVNGETVIEHKCWLLLSFCCGLRVEEVAKLKIQDINSNNHKLKVIGKRNKERYTILPDIVIKFLRLYYKEKKFTKKRGYLFEGYASKEHCSPKSIINYFTLLKKIYNLDDSISFHSLRHSFATYFISNGGDLFVLKSMLGHSSISTTSIYVHIAKDFNKLEGIKYA